MRTCSIIGHRYERFSFTDEPTDLDFMQFRYVLRNRIMRLHRGGYDKFYVALTPGAGLWAALELIYLRSQGTDLELVPILPYDASPKYEPWYRHIFDCCAEEIRLGKPRKYGEEAWLRYVIGKSRTLLAIYDGRHFARSQTGWGVRYAKSLDKRVITINANTFQVKDTKPPKEDVRLRKLLKARGL